MQTVMMVLSQNGVLVPMFKVKVSTNLYYNMFRTVLSPSGYQLEIQVQDHTLPLRVHLSLISL